MMHLLSLDDLEADFVRVIEFVASEFCLFAAIDMPLSSELVDCWLSRRGRIKPREYSMTIQHVQINIHSLAQEDSIISSKYSMIYTSK